MASSRRQSNGRSPLVNQQRQITSFFCKSPPSSAKLSPPSNPNPNPKNPSRSPSPSPNTPSPLQSKRKKPILVIASSEKTKPLGGEVIGKKIKVYWPLDKSWYEGFVKSFDGCSGKHVVQYEDAEEESLDLSAEKIQWIEQSATKFRRLKRGVSKMVIDEDDDGDSPPEKGDENGDSDGDDSSDEDWEKSGEKKMIEKIQEDDDEEMELVDEEVVEDGDNESLAVKKEESDDDVPLSVKIRRKQVESDDDEPISIKIKRKREENNDNVPLAKRFYPLNKQKPTYGEVKTECTKKVKNIEEDKKVSVVESANNVQNGKVSDAFNNTLTNDERFSQREASKLSFLGKERRDGKRRLPGDPDYDTKTLYLPPVFVKSLSDGQKQWWEFKSKHMDKVLFFKMGKFYELFEMDAHIGAKELDLQYMKGDQPHCGFPEKNFSMNIEKLARKGYRVLVVEQTETPEQMEIRRKEKGSKEKVVRREICAVISKGTLTEGEMLSVNPDASYIMAITESSLILSSQSKERIFGVCMVDVATSRVILGQFSDDSECSALSSLLSELRPVEIIKPANQLSLETEKVLLRHTRSPLVNELIPVVEFWGAEKAVSEVKSVHELARNSPNRENVETVSSCVAEDKAEFLPEVLADLARAGEDGSYALSALGGTLFYLKQAFLDETLIRYAKYELLPTSGFSDIISKPYLVLDAAAIENLEIFENSRNGDSAGTLYAQLNHCVTAFGKRLLKTWLARPLYHVESIKERQKAVANLRGDNLHFSLEYRKGLSKLPDMERMLARIFTISEASGRNASKVVLYEDAAKKQLQEFIQALYGCELMAQACSSLGSILQCAESRLLHHLLTPGSDLRDINKLLTDFKDAFDWIEANESGRIIPHEGVDSEYDSACKKTKEIENSLAKFLKEQRKLLGNSSISYATIGKESYLLEVPESLRGSIPGDYELRSSKKGFFRYWTPTIKKLLGELAQSDSEKEASLKNILQRLIRRFCEHHIKWRQLVATTAELDVLISLAIASDYYEGPTCQPTILSSSTDKVPTFAAKCLGHPVLRSDSFSKGSFVPNDITIGGPGNPSFILLTGPNMGGKSTLLRQVCLSVILAQLGADVPAESFELSPVDRIFVRMGATDHIMAGQSTFLTELSETAVMLSSATPNSLVALDELGRGTSTSDGQAIAESVLEHFVHNVRCRGMFSTHYHRLAVDYQEDPKVLLSHMACQVGSGDTGVEEVTFLYRLTCGACPKSYGVNVARLAGLPDSVLQNAAAKSRQFEKAYDKNRKPLKNVLQQSSVNKILDLAQKLNTVVTKMKCHWPETPNIARLAKLQRKARKLCISSS